MEDLLRKIELHAQEIKKEKQSFIACSAQISGNWYKIKFTKDCENAPKKKGIYTLIVNLDDCSLEIGKPYTTKNGKKGISNSIIWVRKIHEITAYTEEDMKNKNRTVLSSVFGE